MAGRNWLTAKLLLEGFEVAVPQVDRGIDLIIFNECGERGIKSLGLQLKCAREKRFSLHEKYKGRGIPIVYIWSALAQPRAFILTYDEAHSELGEAAKKTKSWASGGHYSFTHVSPDLEVRLKKYEHRWSWLRDQLANQVTSGLQRD